MLTSALGEVRAAGTCSFVTRVSPIARSLHLSFWLRCARCLQELAAVRRRKRTRDRRCGLREPVVGGPLRGRSRVAFQ